MSLVPRFKPPLTRPSRKHRESTYTCIAPRDRRRVALCPPVGQLCAPVASFVLVDKGHAHVVQFRITHLILLKVRP